MYGGMVVWWYGGMVVWWYGGVVVWWYGGMVVWWYGGVVGGLVGRGYGGERLPQCLFCQRPEKNDMCLGTQATRNLDTWIRVTFSGTYKISSSREVRTRVPLFPVVYLVGEPSPPKGNGQSAPSWGPAWPRGLRTLTVKESGWLRLRRFGPSQGVWTSGRRVGQKCSGRRLVEPGTS